eukprot:TRINITY_DN10624_c0_g1_i1.p1 TRINITY_DN10624_c0_g1~~TRINITY_DN10624_c0_g1_i1.p1  ORF type:complete len:655 (+),score=110.26 TRINITY_DN10624_c0_g1_i1:47-1966(+)
MGDWDVRLSEQQRLLVNKLALLAQDSTSDNPFPEEDEDEEERIHTAQQFYAWYDKVTERSALESSEPCYVFLDNVEPYLEYCATLISQIDQTDELLQMLRKDQQDVSRLTTGLKTAWQDLFAEETRLTEIATDISNTLDYFILDSLNVSMNNPDLKVTDKEFAVLLSRLDRSISFIQAHPTYLQAELYLLRFKQLQSRGLTKLKNFIVSKFRTDISKLASKIGDTDSSHLAGLSEQQYSKFYVEFRSLVPIIKPLTDEIEKRMEQREYAVLFTDCTHAYFTERNYMLSQPVSKHLDKVISGDKGIAAMFREAGSYLIDIAKGEYDLYYSLFNGETTALRLQCEVLGRTFYERVRSEVIYCEDIDTLSSLHAVVFTELLGLQADRSVSFAQITPPPQLSGIWPLLKRILEEVAARLIDVSTLIIRDEILSYIPSAEDLIYSKGENTKWYPCLDKTLSLLSRLYLIIDHEAFDAVALSCLQACLQNLNVAAVRFEDAQESDLFIISQLLLLQPQLAPFSINFVLTETHLDFSDFLKEFRAMITMRKSVFSLSRDNALYRLIAASAPRFKSRRIDYRQSIETELDARVQSLATLISAPLLDPLESFLAQSQAFLSLEQNSQTSSVTTLQSQEFASEVIVRTL